MTKIKHPYILYSSILTIIIWVAYFIYFWSTIHFPEFYSTSQRLYEYTIMLYHLPILLPAFSGLLLSNKIQTTKWLSLAYALHVMVIIICYITLLKSSDAIEAGLLFITCGLPYSLILGIYTIVKRLTAIKPQKIIYRHP